MLISLRDFWPPLPLRFFAPRLLRSLLRLSLLATLLSPPRLLLLLLLQPLLRSLPLLPLFTLLRLLAPPQRFLRLLLMTTRQLCPWALLLLKPLLYVLLMLPRLLAWLFPQQPLALAEYRQPPLVLFGPLDCGGDALGERRRTPRALADAAKADHICASACGGRGVRQYVQAEGVA
jgi:hypothetical protein